MASPNAADAPPANPWYRAALTDPGRPRTTSPAVTDAPGPPRAPATPAAPTAVMPCRAGWTAMGATRLPPAHAVAGAENRGISGPVRVSQARARNRRGWRGGKLRPSRSALAAYPHSSTSSAPGVRLRTAHLALAAPARTAVAAIVRTGCRSARSVRPFSIPAVSSAGAADQGSEVVHQLRRCDVHVMHGQDPVPQLVPDRGP